MQHLVELALTYQSVEAAPHSCIGEQLLDVEEAAGSRVDPILGAPRPVGEAADGHFGQVQPQCTRAVVEGELDLGHAQARSLGRARKDDVLHRRAPQARGSLGAEHPGETVGNVGLAGAVGTHDDVDTGFELEHGGVGERLEPGQP